MSIDVLFLLTGNEERRLIYYHCNVNQEGEVKKTKFSCAQMINPLAVQCKPPMSILLIYVLVK